MRVFKRVAPFAVIAVVGGMLVYYLNNPSEKIWGANGEPYMVIAGKKPVDARISVRVNYFGRGVFVWFNGDRIRNMGKLR